VPAQILVVHDDPTFCQALAVTLRTQGHTVAVCFDPIPAWEALPSDHKVKVLVTRINFGAGKTNGLALARRAVSNRPCTQVVYLCAPDEREFLPEEAVFHMMPYNAALVAKTVAGLLSASENALNGRAAA